MKVILMNKNMEILECEYDTATGSFIKIYKVCNIDYAPYILKGFYVDEDINDPQFRTNLSDWFKGRGIPSWIYYFID